MKKILRLTLFLPIILQMNSFGDTSSLANNNFIYGIDSLETRFVVLEQDTLHTDTNEILSYSVIQDSIGRKFFVEEKRCSASENNLSKIKKNDTIFIAIKRFKPENEMQIRSLNYVFVIEIQNSLYDLYQTNELCEHMLVKRK